MNEMGVISRQRLPSVDQVLRTGVGSVAIARFGREATVNAVRRVLADIRQARVPTRGPLPEKDAVATGVLELLEREDAPSVRRVFNLTGTVLHTNLGRAILPEVAIE